MAESTQINPRVALATKVRLDEFCKARNYSRGEVVEAALEAYFTPADGDSQTLMFQKMNELGQGMKDIATLLGTVLKLLEQQAKPPPPKIATRDELYPELQPGVVDAPAGPAVEEAPCPHRSHPGVHSSAEGQHHDAHRTPHLAVYGTRPSLVPVASTGGLGRAGSAVCGGARV